MRVDQVDLPTSRAGPSKLIASLGDMRRISRILARVPMSLPGIV